MDRLLDHWSTQCEAVVSSVSGAGKMDAWDVRTAPSETRWLVMKPLEYMNLSGRMVSVLCRRHGIAADKVLVLHDELDLALGTVRFKFSGGLAGHNGLKSVAAHLGTRDFARLRLGIGRPEHSGSMADYVLSPFSAAEMPALDEVLAFAKDAVLAYCRHGLTEATQLFHSRG